MRRRLRKKLRQGEFVEWSMEVSVQLSRSLDERTSDEWFRNLEHRVLPGHDIWWLCSNLKPNFEEMIVSHASRYGKISEDQRHWLDEWLSRQPEVEDYSLGEVTAFEG